MDRGYGVQPDSLQGWVRGALRRSLLASWLSAVVLFLTGMWIWHSVRVDFTENTLFHIKLFLFGIMVLNLVYVSLFLVRKGLVRHANHFLWINLLLGVLVTMIITYIR
ncbi:MAG: hypothetical protein Q9N34_06490 [Aquificota bacterium]|nr:hypothetical protein [Aquificota bacterium]